MNAHVLPDSLTGSILAVEGIADAAVLLNGPTGCKFYHGAVAEVQMPRGDSLDPLRYAEPFYFGQARVPVTYLDGDDYVFGASSKLEEILHTVARKGHRLLAVINSPGAALIGDDLQRFIDRAGLSVPCICIESTEFSGDLSAGFQDTVIAALERLQPGDMARDERSVNLVGLSLYHRHWRGSLQELRRLLELCGVRVGAVLCAGTSVASLQHLRAACCNAVIFEDYADKICPWLEDRIGVKTLVREEGAPVGFDATAAWIEGICRCVKADPRPALTAIDEARKQSYGVLSRFHSLTGLPKGATFAVEADASFALPLTKWLYSYLGMVPVSVLCFDEDSACGERLREYLNMIGCSEAWAAPLSSVEPDAFFASAAAVARLEVDRSSLMGIDIALPGQRDFEVLPKKLLGAEGALYLLEQVINGLAKRCA